MLRHPNIVQFLGACLEKTNLCLVTEFMDKGSLNVVLKKEPKLDWKTKLGIAIDSARGMLFLHLNTPPILHRDLKSLNLLVDQRYTVKVHVGKMSPSVSVFFSVFYSGEYLFVIRLV